VRRPPGTPYGDEPAMRAPRGTGATANRRRPPPRFEAAPAGLLGVRAIGALNLAARKPHSRTSVQILVPPFFASRVGHALSRSVG
jgi:hypothetical protein